MVNPDILYDQDLKSDDRQDSPILLNACTVSHVLLQKKNDSCSDQNSFFVFVSLFSFLE